MNKRNLMRVAFIVVLCSVASVSTALATSQSFTGSTALGTTSFSASSNVTVAVSTDTNGTKYSARAKHAKGDRVVGCASGDAKLWYSTVPVTDTTTVNPANTDAYGGAWLSL